MCVCVSVCVIKFYTVLDFPNDRAEIVQRGVSLKLLEKNHFKIALKQAFIFLIWVGFVLHKHKIIVLYTDTSLLCRFNFT